MNRIEMKWKKNGRRLRFWILRRERIIHTCNYNDDMNSTNLLLSFDMMLFASSSFYYRRWCCIRITATIAFLPPLTHVSYHFFVLALKAEPICIGTKPGKIENSTCISNKVHFMNITTFFSLSIAVSRIYDMTFVLLKMCRV